MADRDRRAVYVPPKSNAALSTPRERGQRFRMCAPAQRATQRGCCLPGGATRSDSQQRTLLDPTRSPQDFRLVPAQPRQHTNAGCSRTSREHVSPQKSNQRFVEPMSPANDFSVGTAPQHNDTQAGSWPSGRRLHDRQQATELRRPPRTAPKISRSSPARQTTTQRGRDAVGDGRVTIQTVSGRRSSTPPHPRQRFWSSPTCRTTKISASSSTRFARPEGRERRRTRYAKAIGRRRRCTRSGARARPGGRDQAGRTIGTTAGALIRREAASARTRAGVMVTRGRMARQRSGTDPLGWPSTEQVVVNDDVSSMWMVMPGIGGEALVLTCRSACLPSGSLVGDRRPCGRSGGAQSGRRPSSARWARSLRSEGPALHRHSSSPPRREDANQSTQANHRDRTVARRQDPSAAKCYASRFQYGARRIDPPRFAPVEGTQPRSALLRRFR